MTYPRQKFLAEIYNEPIFSNTKSDGINNFSIFLNKTVWAKGVFITIKDLCTVTRSSFVTADEFIKSHISRKHIHSRGYLDYLEILKLIPKYWQNKIKQNTALPEQDTIKVMVLSPKRKWQEKNIAETKYKDLYRTCTKER